MPDEKDPGLREAVAQEVDELTRIGDELLDGHPRGGRALRMTWPRRVRLVSVRALIAVFDVYGAFYGYAFKSELWLNNLYYGEGATHLPASCRAMIRAYRSAGEVPGHLEAVRDRVKRIWRAVKQGRGGAARDGSAYGGPALHCAGLVW